MRTVHLRIAGFLVLARNRVDLRAHVPLQCIDNPCGMGNTVTQSDTSAG